MDSLTEEQVVRFREDARRRALAERDDPTPPDVQIDFTVSFLDGRPSYTNKVVVRAGVDGAGIKGSISDSAAKQLCDLMAYQCLEAIIGDPSDG